MAADTSFKVNGKWVLSTKEWLKRQGSDPVEEFKIVNEASCAGGWINLRTGKRLFTFMRPVTFADSIEANGRRQKLIVTEDGNLTIV